MSPPFHHCLTVHSKYLGIFCLILGLAVFYSIRETEFVGTYVPKKLPDGSSSLSDYEKMLAKYPNLKCACGRQSVAMSEFANLSMTVNPSCAWLYADVQKYADYDDDTVSSCEKTKQISFCYTTMKACDRSERTRAWIKKEFENFIIASTELVHLTTLEQISNSTLVSGFTVAELIASTPIDSIESWAMDNMPKQLRMMGDLANRVKALSIKESRFDLSVYGTTSWTDFESACEAATPTCSEEMIEQDLCDTSLRCNADNVADGICNRACLSAACFFDGGDCNYKILHGFEHEMDYSHAHFQMYDANLPYGTPNIGSWMDTREDVYLQSTRRRCDTPERWQITESLPIQDDTHGGIFGGFNYSSLYSNIFNDASKTQPSIEFRASTNLGCDVHFKALEENFFKFFSPEHLANFYSEQLRALREIKNDATLYASLTDSTKDDINYFLADDEPFQDYELNFAAPLMTKHETLRNAILNIFVDDYSRDVDYQKYFDACAVTSCTYTYKSNVSSSAIMSVIIGLVGGITSFMNLVTQTLYNTGKSVITSKSENEEEEKSQNKEGETPATEVEEAHSSRKNSPV